MKDIDKPFLMPIEGVYSISGRGTVATGRMNDRVSLMILFHTKDMSDISDTDDTSDMNGCITMDTTHWIPSTVGVQWFLRPLGLT